MPEAAQAQLKRASTTADPLVSVRGLRAWFFFFQAEDGIRDPLVTGVQTCALPISPRVPKTEKGASHHGRGTLASAEPVAGLSPHGDCPAKVVPKGVGWGARARKFETRSEERRVGKE